MVNNTQWFISLRWVGAVAACLVYCVSRILFRMGLAHSKQYTTRTIHKTWARLILNSMQLAQYTRHEPGAFWTVYKSHNTQDMILAHSKQYTTRTIHKTWAGLILNSIRLTQYTRHAATAPTQRNGINHCVFLNYNFSKEQCMLHENDRLIETCRRVLNVLMWILDH
jgi:hypothetical protein